MRRGNSILQTLRIPFDKPTYLSLCDRDKNRLFMDRDKKLANHSLNVRGPVPMRLYHIIIFCKLYLFEQQCCGLFKCFQYKKMASHLEINFNFKVDFIPWPYSIPLLSNILIFWYLDEQSLKSRSYNSSFFYVWMQHRNIKSKGNKY